LSRGVVADLVQGDAPMTDARDLSEGFDPGVAESAKTAAAERKAAEDQAFADKLAKRPPPNPVERAEIKKARKRTKARAPRIAINTEDRGTAERALYPDHCDEEGHRYRLLDTFGTRSLSLHQNRTCGFPAYGSHLGCVTANACRMRSSACDTRAWL
jgi:hypothetical protein